MPQLWELASAEENTPKNIVFKHAIGVTTVRRTIPVVGRCGGVSYVFNKGTDLAITTLNIKWHGQGRITNASHELLNQDGETVPREVTENIKYSVKWRSLARPLYGITPATRVVKGRFVYVCRYSPDGQVLAIVLNQKCAKDTRLMFCSPLHGTASIADLKKCGGTDESTGRAWWVSDIVWTKDSLLLIGVTRNGALFITSKLGEPINLVTTGCKMDMGPSLYLLLHPRITIRSFQENIPPNSSDMSSGSEKDVFHQKFSVAVHPRFPFMLCSDGYIVTILQFNERLDHAEMMTTLIEEVARLLPKAGNTDGEPIVSEEVKKKPKDVSKSALLISKLATPSENSSPGSTLSTLGTGYGIANDLEAGMLTFGESESKNKSEVEIEKMTKQQKHLKGMNILLQALAIGTTCGPHWTENMSDTMSLVIHTWSKLFLLLLEDGSNSSALSGNEVPFHKIMQCVQSVLEVFQWDKWYQHCLPWLILFTNSSVKTLVNSKMFCPKEVTNVCIRLLRMAEVSMNLTYSWRAVSNRSIVHILGDSYLPLCDTVPSATATATTQKQTEESMMEKGPCYNLEYKLERSWLLLHNYVCNIYQSSYNADSEDKMDHILDEQLVGTFCFIQRKLQQMNCSRNLTRVERNCNPLEEGQKLYLEGKRSRAVSVLRKSFDKNSKSMSCRSSDSPLIVCQLESSLRSLVENETSDLLGDDISFIQQDLSSELTRDADTLLAILYINLESYDLKAAFALVYTFINTNRNINLQDLLDTGTRLETTPPIFPSVGPEGKLSCTSSSSSTVLQLSLLMKYPLASIVDNCALPVVQQLARFMCRYFTNLPLTIPMPFPRGTMKTVSCRKELHDKRSGVCVSSNFKTLSQQKVTSAVAEHKLEAFWTADHTLELLVVSGLIGEAALFASRLGDWKIAFLLSVAQDWHRKNHLAFYGSSRCHSYFPPASEIGQPRHLMMSKIKMILRMEDNLASEVSVDQPAVNCEHVVSHLHNVLKASVIADLDLVPVVLDSLLASLREEVSKVEWLVVQDLYLPAPPLYCPQPTRNEQEILGEEMRKETVLRSNIASIVQKILSVYKASNCFVICAQDYCKHLASHLTHEENNALPNVVKEFLTSDRPRFDSNADHFECTEFSRQLAQESVVKIVRNFQEFCGLMWLVHARDEVALTSRAYSKVKQTVVDKADRENGKVLQKCEKALTWLRRLLPFSDFMHATHHVLDGLLTLIAELPLTNETVDLLAQYFHSTPPFLDLSTTEKLKRLIRKLRNVRGTAGIENGEPLSVRFQEKCKEQTKKSEETPVNKDRGGPLDEVFEFCNSLGYEKDTAYLRFLDTFLLITASKNATERDRDETPLILAYRQQLELVEISTKDRQNENTARTGPSNGTTVGIQRSQSFQDMRRKTNTPLLSPDADMNDHIPLHRSNSLMDFQRVKNTNLSDELQVVLPRLIWLKRWCAVEEGHKGNPAGNRSVSLLDMSTSPAAIRVHVPLRMVVNTLWLMENYYRDFVNAEGRCVKGEKSQARRRRRVKTNGKLVKEPKKKGVKEDKETVLRVRRETALGTKPIPEEDVGVKEITGNDLKKRSQNSDAIQNVDSLDVDSNVYEKAAASVKKPLVTSLEENKAVANMSSKKRYVRKKKPRRLLKKGNKTMISPDFIERLEKPSIIVQNFDEGDPFEDVPASPGVKKELFPLSSSSSIDRKRKEIAPVKHELPFLTLLPVNLSPVVSDNKDSSNHSPDIFYSNSSELFRNSDQESVGECVVGPSFPQSFPNENVSPSSESLSIGQVGSDFIGMIKPQPTIVGNSASSLESKQSERSKEVKTRKVDKRKIVEKSSSCETSGEPSTKSKEEASLLRRIIRSEMRKFIKYQQDQLKSQFSRVETTEDDILSEMSPVDEKSHVKEKTQPVERRKRPRDRSHDPRILSRGKINTRAAQQESCVSSSSQQKTDVSQTSELHERIVSRVKRNMQNMQVESNESSSEVGREPLPTKDGRTKTHTSYYPSKISVRPLTTTDYSFGVGDLPSYVPTHPSGMPVYPTSTPVVQWPTPAHPAGSQAQRVASEQPIPRIPVSGWPFWYQAPFPLAPSWLFSNRANDDKGIQVGTEAPVAPRGSESRADETKNLGDAKRNGDDEEETKVPLGIREPELQSNQAHSVHYKDTSNITVQTEPDNDNRENSVKKTLEKDGIEQAPLLLSLNGNWSGGKRHERQEVTNSKDVFKGRFHRNNFQVIEDSGKVPEAQHADDLPEIGSGAKAFPEQLSQNNGGETTQGKSVFHERLSAHNLEERNDNSDNFEGAFTIPLLRIPEEVSKPICTKLPFKIAWPDDAVDGNTVEQPQEIPLLLLDDMQARSQADQFTPCPLISNVRGSEGFPLLHLSCSAEQDPSLENFHFIDVPVSRDLELPLLHLAQTEQRFPDFLALFLQNSEQTAGNMKSRSNDKSTKAAPSDQSINVKGRNETSNARTKRRHRLKSSAVYKPPTLGTSHHGKNPFPRETASDNSFEKERRGTMISVQPAEKTPLSKEKMKTEKPSKRRDKLKELNDIIRDLERDISDGDDLVLSDVSDILSQEVKYENFEMKPKITTNKMEACKEHQNRKETLNTVVKAIRKVPSRVEAKPSTMSRLHKPTLVSARDIHSEFPSTVPAEATSSDAKVGTFNVLCLPVSIQTDAAVPPLNTFNDLPQSPRQLETKESCIQTDFKDVSPKVSRPEVCDAEQNTEDMARSPKQTSDKSVFPRVPPEVYMDLDLSTTTREQSVLFTTENQQMTKTKARGIPSTFISVADIGEDDVRRQLQEQSVVSGSDNLEAKKDGLKDREYDVSAEVSVRPSSQVVQADEEDYRGDPTTADVLSSLDLQSSSANPVAFGASTVKQTQKVSQQRVTQRLQEMNEKFDAIDRLTSNMDRDLRRSNMLLRTIENLNNVTDHDSLLRRPGLEEDNGRDTLEGARRAGGDVLKDQQRKTHFVINGEQWQTHSGDFEHDILKDESREIDDVGVQNDVFRHQRKPVWQDPPWRNKSIKELTENVNEEEEVNDIESLERKSEDASGNKDIGDFQDNEITNRDNESGSIRESRKSSLSSISSERRPSKDTKESTQPATPRHDFSSSRDGPQSLKLPSADKLKDLLASSTTSTLADSRNRDKSSQKQQELKEWMTKKRKIRHKEWTDKLNEQREAEYKPFKTKTQGEEAAMSSKRIKKAEKQRKESRRAQAKENMDERLMSAYDLMNNMMAESVPEAPVTTFDSTRTTRHRNTKKAARVNNRYKNNHGFRGKQAKTKRTSDGANMKKETGSRGPVVSQLDPNESKVVVYDYDIEESARRFITRKSYERYQEKMSGSLSYDLERSISLGRHEILNVNHSFDSRIGELLDDVSLSGTLNDRKLDNLDSLLSGDSELRELLSDVVIQGHRPRPDLVCGNDEVISLNSRMLSSEFLEKDDKRWKTESPYEIKGTTLGTFKMTPHPDASQRRPYSEENIIGNIVSDNNWDHASNLEMSDEVAALLAEAKAAVGDDFSGTSEVGDIDWNEVDDVLQDK